MKPSPQPIKAEGLPEFLSKAQCQRVSFLTDTRWVELNEIRNLIAEGKIKAVINQKSSMNRALKAFQKLMIGHAEGKNHGRHCP